MPRFHVTHRSDGKFERRGLRSYFEFEYEGVGEVMMKAGSCFYQPPRIRHRELRHSRGVEILEIVSPAKFKTKSVRHA